MAFSLQARVVFPVDRPPIKHGVVSIQGDRIVAVGQHPAAAEAIDLGSVALLPGLVNAHTHLEFSSLTRPLGLPGTPLADWIRTVIAERSRPNTRPDSAVALGWRESLAHGVTTTGEIAAGNLAGYGGPDMTIFLEVIGFSRARADSVFDATLARLEELTRTAPKCRHGISPHAPYTVSPGLVQRLIALACQRKLIVGMHLAESTEELEFLRAGTGPLQVLLNERSMWDPEAVPPGSRPLDYLRLLAGAPRSLVIHGNYLNEVEQAFLAAHRDRMSLVYCPRTHEYFGHRPYPLVKLLTRGVNVAIGTDSRASNPDLDLLAEMRHIARTYPTLDPRVVLRLGTLSGAEALGCGHEIGSLTAGKLANLIAIPITDDAGNLPDAFLAATLASQSPPSAVWFHGRRQEPQRHENTGSPT